MLITPKKVYALYVFMYISIFRSSGEKLIKYHHVYSSCVIISVILMTTLFYKALILQGEN